MNKHIRQYLLHCGYCLLPFYLLGHFTFFGAMFPHFVTTTTSLLSMFLVGGITYSASLIYGYFSGSAPASAGGLAVRGVVVVILCMEFFNVNTSPFQTREERWGPYKMLWHKAYIADLRRTLPDHPSAQRDSELARTHPKIAEFIYGKSTPQASKVAFIRPEEKGAEEAPPVVKVVPIAYKKLSGVSKVGAIIDNKLLKWGSQADGSKLQPNADYSGVTITFADGTSSILELPKE